MRGPERGGAVGADDRGKLVALAADVDVAVARQRHVIPVVNAHPGERVALDASECDGSSGSKRAWASCDAEADRARVGGMKGREPATSGRGRGATHDELRTAVDGGGIQTKS